MTIGDKKLLFIRVDFQDRPGQPISVSQAQQIMEQVNAFYVANSGGKFRFTTEITPVLRLPNTAVYYEIGKTNAQRGQVVTKDTRAAAREAGYDLDLYDLEIVNTRTLKARGGVGINGRKGVFLNGMVGFGITAHELGHNFGLGHADLWLTNDASVIGSGKGRNYGNLFDIMGEHNGRETPLRHFSVWAKHYLKWLPDEAIQTISSSGTYRVFAHDVPQASGVRALKIKSDSERSYWVEFRQLQNQNLYSRNGALLYWKFDAAKQKTRNLLLDTTPGSPLGAQDAPLLLGRTFSDTKAGIYITPIAKGGTSPESLDIVVNIGDFPENVPPQVRIIPDSRQLKRGERAVLKTQASDMDGDPLAYSWQSSTGEVGGNKAEITPSWPKSGKYQIRCTVTDMKGGIAEDEVTITVE